MRVRVRARVNRWAEGCGLKTGVSGWVGEHRRLHTLSVHGTSNSHRKSPRSSGRSASYTLEGRTWPFPTVPSRSYVGAGFKVERERPLRCVLRMWAIRSLRRVGAYACVQHRRNGGGSVHLSPHHATPRRVHHTIPSPKLSHFHRLLRLFAFHLVAGAMMTVTMVAVAVAVMGWCQW